jgi:hypothetical protein
MTPHLQLPASSAAARVSLPSAAGKKKKEEEEEENFAEPEARAVCSQGDAGVCVFASVCVCVCVCV